MCATRPTAVEGRWPADPDRAFWVGLAALTLWRATFVWIAPLDLTGDEAYYWDWGRQLAFGYFSKPPLVAWLARAAGEILGNSEEALRLTSTLLGSLSLATVFWLGRAMWSARVGLLAAALMAASPGNVALNFVLTIDPPLVCCWTGALLATWKALDPRATRRARWALAATVLVGLGTLSKQIMLAFPLAALLFAVGDAEGRRQLRRPWFWLATVAALAFLIPTLMWNARHGWITFQHTRHHFDMNRSTTLDDVLDNLGQFLGSQLGTLSPVTCCLVAAVLISATVGLRRLDRRGRFLWCFFGPGLLVFAVLSVRQHVNANWPAAFYPAALIAVAAWAHGALSLSLRRWRGAARWSVGVGAGLAAVVYALPLLLGALRWEGTERDPTLRLKGWEAYGAAIEERWRQLPDHDAAFLLVVGHRYHASHLAFYAPSQPRVYRWGAPGRIGSQYELWGLPPTGGDALVIVHGGGDPPADLADRFATLTPLDPVVLQIGAARRDYALYHGRGWRGASADRGGSG